jgi:hypothetical protein
MPRSIAPIDKVEWSCRIVAVQPRIRRTRSFDRRSHSYLGYALRIDGICDREVGQFLVAPGEGMHEKHRFQTGMEWEGGQGYGRQLGEVKDGGQLCCHSGLGQRVDSGHDPQGKHCFAAAP